MKKILSYLNEYKKECVLAPLFKMLEATFELIVPLVIAKMIDVGADDFSYTKKCFLILILLGFIGLAASITAQFFAAKAATGFSKGLRHDLFEHILGYSFKQIDDAGTSTLITRLTSDVNTLQNGVNMFLRLFLRSPFILAGAMVMAFSIDVKCALIFVVVIFILGLYLFIIMKTNIPLLKKAQGGLDFLLKITRESLLGSRVIRAFTIEEKQTDRFKKGNDNYTALSLKAGRISGLLNPLTYVIINLGIVALVVTGKGRVDEGILTTGKVVALYNYMSQILLEMIKFANLIITMNKAIASAGRVGEVFEVKKEELIPGLAGKDNDALIEFDNVSFKYNENADEAVSGVSFKIKKGETFGIIGGTGAGKTTIANLLAGYYTATEGEVYLNGNNIKGIDAEEINSNIGMCFQKAVLFEGTIKDNLLWGNKDASDEEIKEALRISESEKIIEEKGGLDAEVSLEGKNFSGGQRQRLSIARALVRKPSVLVFDDSFSALDYLTDLHIRTNLKKLDYNPTVVVIAQRCSSVLDADRILVLDDGDVVGMGSHDELIECCEVYKEIYNSQQYEKGGDE